MDKLLAMYVRISQAISDFKKDERGQNLVEYALIIGVIALLAIVAMKLLGGGINNAYNSAASNLANP